MGVEPDVGGVEEWSSSERVYPCFPFFLLKQKKRQKHFRLFPLAKRLTSFANTAFLANQRPARDELMFGFLAIALAVLLVVSNAESNLKEAEIAYSRGNYQEVLRLLDPCIVGKNCSGEAYEIIGVVAYHLHGAKMALPYFEMAVDAHAPLVSARLLHSFGFTLGEIGYVERGIEQLQRALRVDPFNLQCVLSLGKLLVSFGRAKEAHELYDGSLARHPNEPSIRANYAISLSSVGNFAKAGQVLKDGMGVEPLLGLQYALTLYPPIVPSEAAYPSHVEALLERCDWVRDHVSPVEGVDLAPFLEAFSPVFYLAYQARPLVPVLRRISGLFQHIFPDILTARTPLVVRDSRIRVGFISCHFRVHTLCKLMAPMIVQLAGRFGAIFEVFVLMTAAVSDDCTANFVESLGVRKVVLPTSISAASAAIRSLHLDTLIYNDVSMCNKAYTLAHIKLTPTQLLTLNNGYSSGIPTFDGVVTSFAAETGLIHPSQPGADTVPSDWYSEKVYFIHGPYVHFSAPTVPANAANWTFLEQLRHDTFGDWEIVYYVPQTLFKLHVSFDAAVVQLLSLEPRAVVAFLNASETIWSSQLRLRIQTAAASNPSVMERVLFVGGQILSAHDFVSTVAAADVILDPFRFGGGLTTLEALSAGRPVVTMPSGGRSGRLTASLLSFLRSPMVIRQCVAYTPSEYVVNALRLGRDRLLNRAVTEEIRGGLKNLFGSARPLFGWVSLLVRTAMGKRPELPIAAGLRIAFPLLQVEGRDEGPERRARAASLPLPSLTVSVAIRSGESADLALFSNGGLVQRCRADPQTMTFSLPVFELLGDTTSFVRQGPLVVEQSVNILAVLLAPDPAEPEVRCGQQARKVRPVLELGSSKWLCADVVNLQVFLH